ncbi:MAG: DUF2541 family protein [Alphaproteobacteria bacterium]
MKLTTFAAAIVAGLLVAPVAHAAGWILLGVREVTDRVDHDEIVLAGHARYNHIRVCAYRHPVHFYNVTVHYQNGGAQDVSIASNIPRGGCSRAIDLNGGDRDITRIAFTYEATGWGWHDATVRVYGRL